LQGYGIVYTNQHQRTRCFFADTKIFGLITINDKKDAINHQLEEILIYISKFRFKAVLQINVQNFKNAIFTLIIYIVKSIKKNTF
jgi:hypothetical protein